MRFKIVIIGKFAKETFFDRTGKLEIIENLVTVFFPFRNGDRIG